MESLQQSLERLRKLAPASLLSAERAVYSPIKAVRERGDDKAGRESYLPFRAGRQ